MTKKREEIDTKYKWDLTKIYKSEDIFLEDVSVVEKIIRELSYDEEKILINAKYLYEIYSKLIELNRRFEKIYVYASLVYSEDVTNTNSINNMGLVENLHSELIKLMSKFDAKLLTIDYSIIEEMYKEYKPLLEYKRNLESKFRYKKYTLSEVEERMIASLQKSFEDNEGIYSTLTDSDIDFGFIKDENGKKVKLTNTNYSIYVKSTNRRVRKDAFKKLYKTYSRYKTTLTMLLDGKVKAISNMNKIKGYKSSIFSSLFDDELDVKVYELLVKSIRDGLNPLYKYYKIRKDILGLDKLHIYDTYVPIFNDFDKKYSYEEAENLVKKSLGILGDKYQKILDQAFKNNWIDVYPNKGKRGGAFSGGGYDTFPYVLTNFQGEFNDVSTISHELGHSIHSYFTRKNNPYIYGDYSIVVAEVASTVNEMILSRYIIDNSNDIKEKLYVLDRLINLFKSTIYRQTMYAEFEKFIYEKRDNDEVLTSDILEDYFYKLNKKYYGPYVIIDKELRYEWERMPHLYYNFYVYKYATGLSSACYIVENLLKKDKKYLSKYFDFLSTGDKLSPNDTLKLVGVDLEKNEVFESAIKFFEDLVDQYEKLYTEYKKSSD